MAELFSSILNHWSTTAFWLCIFFVLFGLLAKFSPCNPEQKLWRKDAWIDIAYSLIIPIFTRYVRLGFLSIGAYLFFRHVSEETLPEYFTNGFGPVSRLPIWAQAALLFLISDVILYWTHRWFHTQNMWPFHAIHHSSIHVDWLSTHRFHPVNIWLSFTLVDAATLLAGFAPQSIAALAGFNMFYSAMVHANLNWTFGPFKEMFASPVFHRWHHTSLEEGLNKNFAPTFPLLDIAFGTYYMPEGRLPSHYGVSGSDIPHDFIGQLIWPFKHLPKPAKATSGFTLVEISIVIIIIGLVAGSIMAGRHLIRIAEDRKMVSQLQAIETAVNLFQSKYHALPGDFDQATTYWPAAGAINGNNDGVIDSTQLASFEDYNAWNHLYLAELIKDKNDPLVYVAAPPTVNALDPTIFRYVKGAMPGTYIHFNSPLSEISTPIEIGLNYLSVTSVPIAGGPKIYWSLLLFGAVLKQSAGIWPSDAFYIDTKLDDGLPLTGNVRSALYADSVSGNAISCPVPDATQPHTSQNLYNQDTKTTLGVCGLWIKLQ